MGKKRIVTPEKPKAQRMLALEATTAQDGADRSLSPHPMSSFGSSESQYDSPSPDPSPNRESRHWASNEEYNPAEEVLIRASQYILYLLNGGIFFVYVNSTFFSLDGGSAVSKSDNW